MAYGEAGYGEGGYGGVLVVTRTATVTATIEEDGELTVQVNDDTGAAVEQADVGIENADATFTDAGTTDATGQVVFSGIPIQDYTVSVSKTGYFPTTVAVAAGDFT